MRKNVIFLIILTLITLFSCERNTKSTTDLSTTTTTITSEIISTTSEPGDYYEQLSTYFDQSNMYLNTINSLRIIEEMHVQFNADDVYTKVGLINTADMINEPFYIYSSLEMIYDEDSFISTYAFNNIDGQFYAYEGYPNTLYAYESDYDLFLQKDSSESFSIILNHVPENITKKEELSNNRVVYYGNFSQSDLGASSQNIFKDILDYMVGEGLYSLEQLKDIEVTEEIIIDKTINCFIEINFDISELMTTALNNSGVGLEFNDVESIFTFKLSQFDNISVDQNLINNSILDDAPDYYQNYFIYPLLNNDETITVTLEDNKNNEVYDYDIVKVVIDKANNYQFTVTSDSLVWANLYTKEDFEYYYNTEEDNSTSVLNGYIYLEAGTYYLSITNSTEDYIDSNDVWVSLSVFRDEQEV